MPMAEALLGAGDGEKAWQTISAVPVIEQNSLGFYNLKARAADAANRPVEGFRALAQKALRTGAFGEARSLLQRALKRADPSEIERSRLEYEIAQLEKQESAQE